MLYFVFGLFGAGLAMLVVWRWIDIRAERRLAADLLAGQPDMPRVFDLTMIEGLPEPARRFFRFAIAPGTPLDSVVALQMEGQLALGTKDAPGWMKMRAQQVLAPHHGFIWQVQCKRGMMRVVGSDAAFDRNSWSRFWLLGLLPVVRSGSSADHLRSSFGRYTAEGLFWAPAAYLPREGFSWREVGPDQTRVSVEAFGMVQDVDLFVRPDGSPEKVVFQRWSNANPDKRFQAQPFGGALSDFKTFGGFTLPTRVEAGNFYGTADYYPFFKAHLTQVTLSGQFLGNERGAG